MQIFNINFRISSGYLENCRYTHCMLFWPACSAWAGPSSILPARPQATRARLSPRPSPTQREEFVSERSWDDKEKNTKIIFTNFRICKRGFKIRKYNFRNIFILNLRIRLPRVREYRVFIEFLYTFEFAAKFSISNPIEKRLEEKIWKRQRQNPKNKKVELWPIFEPFLGDQNGHPELDPRVYVLGQVIAGEGPRERNDKKER